MKSIIFSTMVLSSAFSNAETYSMQTVFDNATQQESSDLAGLLRAIKTQPFVNPQTGKNVMRVISVEKGSVYDRLGIKPGDYLEAGNSSDKRMELRQGISVKTKEQVKE